LFTDSLRNMSSAALGPSSSPAELSSSTEHFAQEQEPSILSCCVQPSLSTTDPPVSSMHLVLHIIWGVPPIASVMKWESGACGGHCLVTMLMACGYLVSALQFK
jgi:hypothetical protein